LKTTFSCGGCDGQDTISKRCKNWLNSIPGFCWQFAWCFKDKCRNQYGNNRKRSAVDVPDTCYNKVCDDGENVNNCPHDCCQAENDKCKMTEDECIPECCGESTCCSSGNNLWQTLRKERSIILFCVFALIVNL
jgi:hypothetical protein